jgi:hypothetical protein
MRARDGFKVLTLAVGLTLGAVARAVCGDATGLGLERLELEDQFGKLHRNSFPTLRPTVLLAADKRGYQDLEPWIQAVRERFPKTANIVGVADVRGVPGLLRGKVRRRFASAENHAILLDWDGAVLAPLRPVKGVPNAYLLSAEGRVKLHLSGAVTPAKMDTLQGGLSALQPAMTPPDAAVAVQ